LYPWLLSIGVCLADAVRASLSNNIHLEGKLRTLKINTSSLVRFMARTIGSLEEFSP
jgi:hypothetical protein